MRYLALSLMLLLPALARADAFEINQRLGRGVNIIGYDPLWRDASRARFKEAHFKLIKEAGFTNVRLPLHPFRDVKTGPDHQLSEQYLKTLDWAIAQALSNKLMVIVDFHQFQEMARNYEGNKPRMLAMWKQLAEHLKAQPDAVLFEILNEPNGQVTPEVWNGLLKEALAIIRASNPTRTVIIGPGQWNNIAQLDKLELSESDRNLIVTVHYYSPFEFTHQGASWTNMKDKTGIKWEGTDKEKAAIEKDFARAQAWAQKHKRPIFLGEFGAYDKADMDSRVRWTSFVCRHAEKLGWSWAYWQFDGDFIVYNIRESKWVEPIRDALVPGGK